LKTSSELHSNRNAPIVAERIGYSNVESRKGRIQDLGLDLNLLDQELKKNSISDAASTLTATFDTTVACERRYRGTIIGIRAQGLIDGLHFLSAGTVSFARGLNDTPKIAALLVTTASLHGLAVSTTHVSGGALLGMGMVTGQAKWETVLPVLAAWVVTLPCAAIYAGLIFYTIRSLI
jgi:Phosphate transporter family